MIRRDSQTSSAYQLRVVALSAGIMGCLLILCAVMLGGCGRKRPASLTHQAVPMPKHGDLGVDSPSWHAVFNRIRLGASEQELAAIMDSEFYQAATNTFLFKYPFQNLLPDVNPSVVTEWRTTALRPDGWPEVVFAVFTDARKTNLVDAFWFKDRGLIPVVGGLFDQSVRAVKPGDSIEAVYRLLGKRNAEYFRSSDGKWRVKFIYWAHRGRIFVIEADAAEGRVLRAGDGTI